MKSSNAAIPDSQLSVTIPTEFSIADLVPILGVSRPALIKKSKAEQWVPSAERRVQGGLRRLFSLQNLPTDVQKRVLVHYGQVPDDLQDCVPDGLDATFGQCWRTGSAIQQLRPGRSVIFS